MKRLVNVLVLRVASCLLLLSGSVHGQNWSDPATWGGQVPQAGAAVMIPANRTVVLDVDPPPLGSLMIMGRLQFADGADRTLTAGWIMIHGNGSELQVGTEQVPFQSRATIILTGSDETQNVMGVFPMNSGTKFIMPMEGGTLRLHGASREKRAWTVLSEHAAVGATRITVRDATGWAVGDRIVIAPSGFDPRHAEVRTIAAIDGRTIDFSPPLVYRRWGTQQAIGGRTIDTRAEVGLLSRNIVVRGADDSMASGFGGHIMVMGNARAYVEGVELFRMGQTAHKGRYPFHWHWVTRSGFDASGQYFRDSAIHSSFHRAVVVHGTSGVEVSDNVSFDVLSHAFVPAEDGDEINNRFEGNLAVLTRAVENSADVAFPGGGIHGLQNEKRAGAFWMKNPNNFLRGNRAAGVLGGFGFFFDGEFMDRFPNDSDSEGLVRPAVGAHAFEDNVAHSVAVGDDESPYAISGIGSGAYVGHNRGNGLFIREATRSGRAQGMLTILRFSSYKTASSAAWIERENELLDQVILIDAPAGVDAKSGIVRNSVIAPRTANDIGGRRHGYTGVFYNDSCDNGFIVEDTQIIDAWDGAIHTIDDFNFGDCRSRRISLVRSLPFKITEHASGSWLDEDGSLSGIGPGRISNFAIDSRSVAQPAWQAFFTPDGGAPPAAAPSITLVTPRWGGVAGAIGPFPAFYILPRIVGWPMREGGAHWRLTINGLPWRTEYSGRGIHVDSRTLPSSWQPNGSNTLRGELYTEAGQPTGVLDEVTFDHRLQPELRIATPLDGRAVFQPFAVAYDCAACRGVSDSLQRRVFRVRVDGEDVGRFEVDAPVMLDGLAGGLREIEIALVDADSGAVVAAHSVGVYLQNGAVPEMLFRSGFE